MTKRSFLFAMVSTMLFVGIAAAQAPDYPMMDMVANKVVEKYQQSTCEQLWQRKRQKPTGPKAQMEQRAIQALRNDPQMREAFINRVAGPIANKMFECGMIP